MLSFNDAMKSARYVIMRQHKNTSEIDSTGSAVVLGACMVPKEELNRLPALAGGDASTMARSRSFLSVTDAGILSSSY